MEDVEAGTVGMNLVDFVDGSQEDATDIVALVIDTVNDMASKTGTPTFQDMVGRRIQKYARFTNELMQAETQGSVLKIVSEHGDAKELNDKVQLYIKLAKRGIVTIDPSELICTHIYNETVRAVSDQESGDMLCGLDQELDYSDFIVVTDSIVLGAAAAQLLGGVKFWATPDVLPAEQYALVHSISSTKH